MKQYDMLRLFRLFIKDSLTGKRKQRNGNKIKTQTIDNYQFTCKLLEKYQLTKGTELRIRHMKGLDQKENDKERLYWQKFAREFTDFLYSTGMVDNTVGMHCKNLKTFFAYLSQYRSIDPGPYYKNIRVMKEETPVIVLNPDRLKFLINDQSFRDELPFHLKPSLDTFIIGCTTGLRFSDLIKIRQRNLEKTESGVYLIVISQKTQTPTRIKLPEYALTIIESYRGKHKTLLPKISLNQFNKNLKKIFELAGWTEETGKFRNRRGISKSIKTYKGKPYRFCDLASSHIMRKTSITTMLMMGMPEPLVRKISGHAANSKEFYRYVRYTQSFVDEHTDKVFEKLTAG